jgi:hypothetical protein
LIKVHGIVLKLRTPGPPLLKASSACYKREVTFFSAQYDPVIYRHSIRDRRDARDWWPSKEFREKRKPKLCSR